MVYARTAIRTGLQIAQRLDRKYNFNKLFVDRYVPPGYKETVNRIFDVTTALGGGYGIYNLLSGNNQESGNGISQAQYDKNNKYQTRNRFSKYHTRRNSFRHTPCKRRRQSTPYRRKQRY